MKTPEVPSPSNHSLATATQIQSNRGSQSAQQDSGKTSPTFGQRLADKMASKVGSWPFLIGQTAVLAGWIGANSIPGLPHWDQSPFILLNLMFSFASAYTAPIVLMSQNRQSDEDRDNAAENHRVNLQTAAQIELLQQKIDTLSAGKIDHLIELLEQQQITAHPLVSPITPIYRPILKTELPGANRPLATSPNAQTLTVPLVVTKPSGVIFVDAAGQGLFQAYIPLENLRLEHSLPSTAQMANPQRSHPHA